MRSTIEQEIQALTREFIDDLTQLVRQHTLEVVLEGLQEAPTRARRAKAEPTVELGPRPRRAKRRPKVEELPAAPPAEATSVAIDRPARGKTKLEHAAAELRVAEPELVEVVADEPAVAV